MRSARWEAARPACPRLREEHKLRESLVFAPNTFARAQLLQRARARDAFHVVGKHSLRANIRTHRLARLALRRQLPFDAAETAEVRACSRAGLTPWLEHWAWGQGLGAPRGGYRQRRENERDHPPRCGHLLERRNARTRPRARRLPVLRNFPRAVGDNQQATLTTPKFHYFTPRYMTRLSRVLGDRTRAEGSQAKPLSPQLRPQLFTVSQASRLRL